MADIKPFRKERRLRSLDECEGPRLKFNTRSASSISPVLLVPVGVIMGAGLGYLIFF